jgi:hypothetical protein
MIRSFGDKRTAALFDDKVVSEFAGFAPVASGNSSPLTLQTAWKT